MVEGRFGVQLGADVLEAGPGDLCSSPAASPHAFWNAGDEPARLLELISPAGFEDYFRELAPLLAAPGGTRPRSARWSPATSSTSTSPPSPPWPSATTCAWGNPRPRARPQVAARPTRSGTPRRGKSRLVRNNLLRQYTPSEDNITFSGSGRHEQSCCLRGVQAGPGGPGRRHDGATGVDSPLRAQGGRRGGEDRCGIGSSGGPAWGSRS